MVGTQQRLLSFHIRKLAGDARRVIDGKPLLPVGLVVVVVQCAQGDRFWLGTMTLRRHTPILQSKQMVGTQQHCLQGLMQKLDGNVNSDIHGKPLLAVVLAMHGVAQSVQERRCSSGLMTLRRHTPILQSKQMVGTLRQLSLVRTKN